MIEVINTVLLVSGLIHLESPTSTVQVVLGLIMNLAAWIITGFLKKDGHATAWQIKLLILIHYVLFVVWGSSLSVGHFIRGEQIIMFFLVIIGYAMFIVFTPLESFLLIFIPFIVFRTFLATIDDPARINIINYDGLGFLIWIGSINRYKVVRKQLADEIYITKLNKRLSAESRTDALTGMNNRFALDDHMHDYLGQQVSILMADIDYFKQFNDTYGHAIGDQVLKAASNTLM